MREYWRTSDFIDIIKRKLLYEDINLYKYVIHKNTLLFLYLLYNKYIDTLYGQLKKDIVTKTFIDKHRDTTLKKSPLSKVINI